MKNICILGSTGSIGTQALEVIGQFPEEFRVVGLSTKENIELLEKQTKEFNPLAVCVANEKKAEEVASKISIPVYSGEEGLVTLAEIDEAELILVSVTGISGLIPTIHAIKKGKNIALANKEALVVGGDLIMQEAAKKRVKIYPVDSEHSAVYQCLLGEDPETIERIILTCSGGPFYGKKKEDLENISADQALQHPRWEMGQKITIDSATLMNKGLEVIEASYLFDLPPEKIDVVIHPQAIIHSMVEYKDGTVKAHLSEPDMKLPLQYTLFQGQRKKRVVKKLDFQDLTFDKPDQETFPCLAYAYEALEKGGTMPCVMNAANEVAVGAFLKGNIGFLDIPKVVRETMDAHRTIPHPSLQDLLRLDEETKEKLAKDLTS